MSATPKQIFDSAMDLSDEERAELVGMLLDSLDIGEEDGVGAAWLKEIERRVAELDSGAVDPVPWSEVRSRVFGASAR